MSLPLLTKLSKLGNLESTTTTKEAVLASIEDEISRLFETRVSQKNYSTKNISILDYGVIDNIFEKFTDELEISRAENYLCQVVEHFEPRVRNVNVSLVSRDIETIALDIKFLFEFNSTVEEVNFTIDARKLN